MTDQSPSQAFDAVHYVDVVTGCDGELQLTLVCTAAPGAPCRKRPSDDREQWNSDDPDLVDDECWAKSWVSALSFGEAVRTEHDADTRFTRVAVRVSYDEGVIVEPVDAHPTLKLGQRKPRVARTVEAPDAVYDMFAEDGGEPVAISDASGILWLLWTNEDGDVYATSWPEEDEQEDRYAVHLDAIPGPQFPATVLLAEPVPVSAEQVEAAVQAAYFQIAAERSLSITPVGDGRAQVPSHWRAEAKARALPILRAAGLPVAEDGA